MNRDAPLQVRQTLRMLGFTDSEIKILVVLFRQRKLTSKDISRLTVLSFDTVHYLLNSLEKKHIIVRSAKNGDDIVEIRSNKGFLEWITEQREKNASVYNEAQNLLSGFFTSMEESSWKPNVLYFEGKEGIIDIYEDMIETGEDIRCWTDIQKIGETIGVYMDTFIRKRVEKGIRTFAIMPKNKMNQEYATKKDEMRDTRFSDNLPINGEIRIYGDKVAVITFNRKKPVGFVLSGQVVTSLFKCIFDHSWNHT